MQSQTPTAMRLFLLGIRTISLFGTADPLGDADTVRDGVAEALGVSDGVKLGVADALGVLDGVSDGVAEADGVCDGVSLGEYPIGYSAIAKACFVLDDSDTVMSMTPESPVPDQSQWPKVCENPESAVPSS